MHRSTPYAVLIIAISGFLLVSAVGRVEAECDGGTCISLTKDEVAAVAYGADFRGGALVYAIAIAYAESTFQLNAINHNSATSIDYGLWQINTYWHPEYLGHENDLLYNASYNAKAAYEISSAGADWCLWATFWERKFEKWLRNIARPAAQAIDSTVIRPITEEFSRVMTTMDVNVRDTAGGSLLRTVTAGMTGTVLDGPQVQQFDSCPLGPNYYIWWKIHWDDGGEEGWSVEDAVARIDSAPPNDTINSVDPPPGSILSDTETFTWNAVSNATEYWVYLGTSVESRNLFDSGSLGSATSVTIPGIPQDGQDLYLRIWYRVSGQWLFNDFSYTADTVIPTVPEMVNPPPESALSSSTVTFEWTNGDGIAEYWIYIGSTRGGKELYSQSQGLNLSGTVAGLPTDGRTLYVRLWFRTGSNTWNSNDYTYTAFDDGLPDSITSVDPPPGNTLADSDTFTWNSVTNAAEYWVYLGTSIGSRNLFDSGSLGNATSVTVPNIPQNGSTIWLRIWYRVFKNWRSNDFSYTTSAPEIVITINPIAGSTLSDTETFTWSAVSNATEYWVYFGTSIGSRNLFNSGYLGSATSVTISGIPQDGRELYLRIWYRVSGEWLFNDFSYTTNAPELTDPDPGSTLTSSTVTFEWTSGTGVAEYWIYIGSIQDGKDVYTQSQGLNLSVTVTDLPTDGRTLYLRLWFHTGSSNWNFNDYTYTALDGR